MIEADLVLRLTMLLHDVGKPFVWDAAESVDYDRFDDHAAASAAIADKVLRDLKYDNATRKDVVALIAHHNDILLPEAVNIRRALSHLGEVQTRRLVKVKVADMVAHDLGSQREEMCALFSDVEAMIDTIIRNGDCTSIADLAIDGEDMKALGLKGRAIGQMLHQALELVIEEPSSNQHDHLMVWAQAQLAQKIV